MKNPLEEVEEIIALRKKEADHFYDSVHPKHATAEEKMIQRQAIAGVLWSKQIYLIRREFVAGRRQSSPSSTSCPQTDSQYPLASSQFDADPFNAG